MSELPFNRPPEASGPPSDPPVTGPADAGAPSGPAPLDRVERLLADIHGMLDAQHRESQHDDMGPLRLVAFGLQIVAIGLVIVAALDWFFGELPWKMFAKLAFAIALQLGTIAALLMQRR